MNLCRNFQRNFWRNPVSDFLEAQNESHEKFRRESLDDYQEKKTQNNPYSDFPRGIPGRIPEENS